MWAKNDVESLKAMLQLWTWFFLSALHCSFTNELQWAGQTPYNQEVLWNMFKNVATSLAQTSSQISLD